MVWKLVGSYRLDFRSLVLRISQHFEVFTWRSVRSFHLFLSNVSFYAPIHESRVRRLHTLTDFVMFTGTFAFSPVVLASWYLIHLLIIYTLTTMCSNGNNVFNRLSTLFLVLYFCEVFMFFKLLYSNVPTYASVLQLQWAKHIFPHISLVGNSNNESEKITVNIQELPTQTTEKKTKNMENS